MSAVLASAADRVVDDAVAALERHHQTHHQTHHQASTPEERRRYLRDLFGLVVQCAHEGHAEPIIASSQQIAADRAAAGFDIAETQGTFNVLEEVLWRHIANAFAGDQRIEALRVVNTFLGAGKDALARTYVALASRGRSQLGEQPAVPRGGGDAVTGGAAAGAAGLAGAAVKTEVLGQVGVITLADQRRRNAISAQTANGVAAAFGSLRARGARAIVLRAAAGMHVWSAGHDINELPRGRRDPLAYNDPLEQLLRAIRTFPAPVVAMVHGSVWGGAFDLVLSCDLMIADETATFAITAANLGLPYNTTGLLHSLGRLPVNLVKEMFFTTAPLDAQKAKEWLVVNHLVGSAELEGFTFDLAATMASKSPLAMAVVKEQLTDYQPIAAQVYERVQGLRREAYDSSDYLEGLNAFAEKRQPIFRGT
jgi:methylmalonyl-CoA decarboxylase